MSLRRSIGFCLIALLAVSGPARATIPAAERQVLLDLYNSTNGAGWTDSTGWNGAVGTECSWYGVTCDGSEFNVTAIALSGNNLTGTLPSIGNLTQLTEFRVANNSIGGGIPALTGLSNLTFFGAYSNALTGPIPSLSGLVSLQQFFVESNQLSGTIPSLAGLSSLQEFNVGGNQLGGSIPSLAGLSSLRRFFAYQNQLSGSIPSLAGLTALEEFAVGDNQLSGALPSLSGLSSLTKFGANGNQLSGSIPAFTGVDALTIYNVGDNLLTGPIPSLASLSALSEFSASNNQLTGSTPSLSGLTALLVVELSNNKLDGTISPLAGATSLQFFDVPGNQLTGSIPPLAGLTALKSIRVEQNQLTGSIPDLSGLADLTNFSANENALTGSIPALTGSPALQSFVVRDNALTGPLPALTGLTQLYTFEVGNNPVSGAIPSLAGLVSLIYFEAYGTALDGPIPSLAGLSSLEYFNIYYSNVAGPIPPLTGLTNLKQFTADGNQLTGSPPSLTGLTLLQSFTASYNRLTGQIPPLAGEGLGSLSLYDVTHNQLTGPVPELAGVGNPESFSFWASQNQLSGEIPSLAGASNLSTLELGQNLLTGEPPVPPSDGILAYATLCSNPLEHTDSAFWDFATQQTPWYEACTRLTAAPSLPTNAESAGVGTAIAAADGLVAVGAPQSIAGGEQGGQVLVYDGSSLGPGKAGPKQGRFEAKALTDVNLSTLELPFPVNGDKFGLSGIGASPDGNTIAVGVPGANANTGAVAIFKKPLGGWAGKVLPTDVLVPPEATAGTQVGASVTITNAGTIVVGGPGAVIAGQQGAGAVWVIRKGDVTFTISAPIVSGTPQAGAGFGSAVSGEGSELAVGAPGQDAGQGQVETFREASGAYSPLDVVVDAGGSAGDRFGASVSITDGQMVVGAPGRDAPQAPDAGAAMVFAQDDTGTAEPTAMLTSEQPQAGAALGTSVQMSGDVAVVGAPMTDIGSNPDQGVAAVYVQPDYGSFTGALIPTGTLFNASGDQGFGFGTSVAVFGGLVAVGEPFFGGVTVAAKGRRGAKALAGVVKPGEAIAYTDEILFKEGFESPRGAVGNCTFPNTAVPDNNAVGITSDFTVPGVVGKVKDLNVSVSITHTFVSDLRLTLIHVPTGKTVPLYFPNVNCPSANLDVDFDDQALGGFARDRCSQGTPGVEGRLLPNDWLTRVQGVTRAGPWRLRVVDAVAGNTGTLKSWCVQAR